MDAAVCRVTVAAKWRPDETVCRATGAAVYGVAAAIMYRTDIGGKDTGKGKGSTWEMTLIKT